MSKGSLNVLLSSNAGYVMPLSVCLTSLFENNKNRSINVFVMHESLNDNDKLPVLDIAKKYGQTVSFVKVDSHYFEKAPVLYWSKETYYRLLAGELLPDSIERILYVDCDIIVNGSLDELYDTDLGECVLAAVYEDLDAQLHRKRIGIAPVGLYYQAGVILFDLRRARKMINYRVSLDIIQKLGADMWAPDQDIINVVFDGRIKSMPEKFNNYKITNFYGRGFDRLLNRVDTRAFTATVIFHYIYAKPWKGLFQGACEDIWYSYLKLSPYKSLYLEKFGTPKARFLRVGVFKAVFAFYKGIIPFSKQLAKLVLPESLTLKLKIFYRKYVKQRRI